MPPPPFDRLYSRRWGRIASFLEEGREGGGAAAVAVQTGGVTLNMVTRRGGNRTSLAGRFYLTDNFFLADNLTPALVAGGLVNTGRDQTKTSLS